METIEVATTSEPLAEIAGGLGDEAVILAENGAPIAAIVSLKNLDREPIALSTSPEFLAIIEQARADFAAGRSRSLDEMRRAVSP